MSVPAPCGLARLPEELVDLVCSVVLTFDSRSSSRTLSSLALTSRQFLAPARRALLFDPTWIFHSRRYSDDRVVEDLHKLLNYLIKRPEMGAHVRSLTFLSLVYACRADEFGRDLAFDNWTLSLLRLCPNLTAIMIWPALDFGWPEELARLPRLRRIYVMPRHERTDLYDVDEVAFHAFLGTLSTNRIEKLSLDTYKPPPSAPLSRPQPPVHLANIHLELDDCKIVSWTSAGLDVDDIRALTISCLDYERPAVGADLVLPGKLEEFVLHPGWEGPARSWRGWSDQFIGEWSQLFPRPAQCPILREVALRAVPLDAASFAKVCAAAPNVIQVDMRDSRWRVKSATAAAALDGVISRAIGPLAHLRYLDLGEVPGGEAVLEHTRAWCERAGVKLSWQSVPLPLEEAGTGASAAS